MGSGQNKNHTTRFLIGSFIGLLLFSIAAFNFLGLYMNQESKNTIYETGKIYMSGMSEQLSRHFENIIKLRFDQAEGIVSVVSTENISKEELYKELVYRTQVRGFDYLALCSSEGEFETLYGAPIQSINPQPFLEALKQGEKRITVGVDTQGEEVALIGIQANYPMQNGEESVGLVAAIPLHYITDFLSLEEEDALMYCHIIRPDGSFVIRNSNTELYEYFDLLQNPQDEAAEEESVKASLDKLRMALRERANYDAILEVSGENRQIYGQPLPYSEWYLIAVMPYGVLDESINRLGVQRMQMTLLACGSILAFLTLMFIRYFILTRQQMKELEKVRQAALESSRAKSEFLANMSHDIRTPMNAIVGMTAIATAHIEDREQVQNCLKKITLSSKHLLGLINDVLDMSKIESGKLTLTSEKISLKEVIEGIVSIIQPQIKAKEQRFDVHIENIMTENVYCDSVRLNQVLLNLLSNATKYTQEKGCIQLSIREEKSSKGEDYVQIHIVVKDNGIGMSPEFLEKIYDSYSRADGTRVHKTEGAGLGMAITKYIVDAMKGTIDVQSEIGKGTEFHIAVDFEKADMPEENMILPPWHMLLVDDDEVLCRTAAATLETIGIQVEWTLSGEDAVKRVLQEHRNYQIILLDWKLPSMDGLQVAKAIRRGLEQEIPILLISAYDWNEIEAEAHEAGISGFIPKPLFKSTLFYYLRQYMDKEREQDLASKQDMDMSGCRILLAEDNELNWEIASELLSDLGMELEWAEDGQMCLEKFQSSPEGYYDFILMDIRMPRMTGYEATKAIRALHRKDAASIPIIAMTADAFAEDVERCLECGMNAHIAKPINVAELTRLMKKYLG